MTEKDVLTELQEKVKQLNKENVHFEMGFNNAHDKLEEQQNEIAKLKSKILNKTLDVAIEKRQSLCDLHNLLFYAENEKFKNVILDEIYEKIESLKETYELYRNEMHENQTPF
jgi:hypothetical protein